jgi:ubiquinol-cytochrome c reductase iron-sulfur subunit
VTSHRRMEQVARRVVVGAFGATTAAALSLVALSFGGHSSTQLDGLLYFVVFAGVGIGLIVWANALLGDGQHAQQREPLRADEAETAVVDAELSRDGQLERRVVIRRSLWVAGGAMVAAVAAPIRSLGPAPGRKLLVTAWADGVGVATADGVLVKAADVPLDGLLTVFPENDLGSADGQVVLVRVDPQLLRLPASRQGWAPDGLIAFSKVCTHAGCPVGLYQADSHRLLCPCHQSSFDVLDAAKPLSGPAAWPLPQLPLTVDEAGVLRAAGGLSEPVGPGWWKR